MRCHCQDQPADKRDPCCPACGGTGIASCCEAERPTWAERDKGDERVELVDENALAVRLEEARRITNKWLTTTYFEEREPPPGGLRP